jgi:hypothetical protein
MAGGARSGFRGVWARDEGKQHSVFWEEMSCVSSICRRWLLTVAVMAAPAAATAAPDVNTLAPRQAVKPAAVFGHHADLEAIADANGGTRDTRTPGYQASVDHVVNQLQSYGYRPQIVQFNLPEWVENSTPLLSRTHVDPDKAYVPAPPMMTTPRTSTSSPSSSRPRAT